MSDGGVVFGKDDARRIGEATKTVEAEFHQPTPGRLGRMIAPVVAKIEDSEANSSGYYDATEQKWNGTSWVNRDNPLLFGTGDVSQLFEISANTEVAAGSFVIAWPTFRAGASVQWVFAAGLGLAEELPMNFVVNPDFVWGSTMLNSEGAEGSADADGWTPTEAVAFSGKDSLGDLDDVELS